MVRIVILGSSDQRIFINHDPTASPARATGNVSSLFPDVGPCRTSTKCERSLRLCLLDHQEGVLTVLMAHTKRNWIVTGTLMTCVLMTGCAATGEPSRSQHDEIVAVVNGLFEAMRTKDEAGIRGTYAEEIAFTAIDPERGVRTILGPPDRVVDSIVNSDAELIERMWDPEVRVDGDLATLWAPYEFSIDGDFSHCGVNAIHLVRRDNAWRIVGVAFTRRTEDCP
jgi:hypothetical protein